ncbi:MAG: 16S rRNA (cytosine(1402)-N(4))-methyltransferase RsmH [Proteobacteria bacterium]|nr:16S rRNA (cytosine(1402)-N(4))-methyltransferase RsmH [Pseudomonadota bacterium]
MNNVHRPVLLEEVISFVKDDYSVVFDGTFGGGGHSSEILEKFKRIKVIAVDIDESALFRGKEKAKEYNDRLLLIKENFKNIDKVLKERGVEKVDFILADLGVSSNLLEDKERGFSFMKDGPLDMRMDRDLKIDARFVINNYSVSELAEIFKTLGEEPRALKIARQINEERKKAPIVTTKGLSDIICKVVRKGRGLHPATLVFQALRIYVNRELDSLKEFLNRSVDLLSKGGRVAIISFHSLEDRIVKNFFREEEKKGLLRILTKKPVTPKYEEVRTNRRARSAKLRVAEKIV